MIRAVSSEPVLSTRPWKRHKMSGATMTPFTSLLALVKKRRDPTPVDPTTRLAELNKKGLANMQKGDARMALLLFREALSRPETRHWLVSGESKTTQATAFLRKAQACSIVATTSGSEKESFQRMDFDEGMNVFLEAEPVRLEDDVVAQEATLLYNVAQAHRCLEDYASAYRYYMVAMRRLLPEAVSFTPDCCPVTQHHIVIPILHNLGQLKYWQGRIKEASAFYKLALTHCRALHGLNDLSVGIALNCLGVLCYHMAAPESAQSMGYFHEALLLVSAAALTEGRQSQHGVVINGLVATILNNMGRVHVQHDNFIQALVYYDQALRMRRTCLGTDKVDYAATCFNAGQSLHQLGHHSRALVLYEEFLRVARLTFRKSHRDIAVVLSSIAQIHQQKRNFDKALQLYTESLSEGRAALGCSHSEIAMLLNRIGNFHFERENYNDALTAYQEGLNIERTVLQPSHPNIVVSLSNIGEIYRQTGRYELAISTYEEALALQKRLHGECSSEVASVLNLIGLIHDQQGVTDKALARLQEALVMRREIQGDDHMDVSATLTYLGSIFFRRNSVAMALKVFLESLRIRRQHLGNDHRDVAFTLYNVGLCHFARGNTRDAMDCFKETLRIEECLLGAHHRDVALTLLKMGEACKAECDWTQALKYYRRALAIERKTSRGYIRVAQTINEIGNLHLHMNNTKAMMKAFSESARAFQYGGLDVTAVTVSPVLRLYATDFLCSAAAA